MEKAYVEVIPTPIALYYGLKDSHCCIEWNDMCYQKVFRLCWAVSFVGCHLKRFTATTTMVTNKSRETSGSSIYR